MQETWVRSLGWEDPLKKEMATHSSTPAWKIPWTEEPDRLQISVSWSMRLSTGWLYPGLAFPSETELSLPVSPCPQLLQLQHSQNWGAKWISPPPPTLL